MVDSFVVPGAPEPLLVVADGVDALGNDPHPDDSRAETTAKRVTGDGAAALQLPAHPVNDIRRRERTRMQPGALRQLSRLGIHLDTDRRADEPGPHQLFDEAVSGCPEAEGHLVDAVERWFEPHDAVELLRHDPRHYRTTVETAREGVHPHALVSESRLDILRLQLGEIAEGTDAQTPQERCKGVLAQQPHRHAGEKLGGSPLRYDADALPLRTAGRVFRGERPVGNTHP